jgi:hypothetical protein
MNSYNTKLFSCKSAPLEGEWSTINMGFGGCFRTYFSTGAGHILNILNV